MISLGEEADRIIENNVSYRCQIAASWRQLHMREVGRTDAKAFEQGFIQRLEIELMAEKLIFPPQQTIVMAGALFREHTRLSEKHRLYLRLASPLLLDISQGEAFRQPLESVAIHAKAETTVQ